MTVRGEKLSTPNALPSPVKRGGQPVPILVVEETSSPATSTEPSLTQKSLKHQSKPHSSSHETYLGGSQSNKVSSAWCDSLSCENRAKCESPGFIRWTKKELKNFLKQHPYEVILVMESKLYRVTCYMMNHPGGPDMLKRYNGEECGTIFRRIHGLRAWEKAKPYCFGELIKDDQT